MKILFGSVPAEECFHGPMSMPPDTGRRAAGAAAERLHPVYAVRVMIMVWTCGRRGSLAGAHSGG